MATRVSARPHARVRSQSLRSNNCEGEGRDNERAEDACQQQGKIVPGPTHPSTASLPLGTTPTWGEEDDCRRPWFRSSKLNLETGVY